MSKLKNHLYRVSVFINDKNKKSYITIIKDVLYLVIKNKRFPLYYFGRFLYRKEAKNIKYYLSLPELYKIIKSKKLNPKEIASIIDNKIVFYKFCESFNIPIPTVFCYNFYKTFHYKGNCIELKKKKDLIFFYKQFFEGSIHKKIILKPLEESGGKGIILLNKDAIDLNISSTNNSILNNSYIHQEYVLQHSEINKIYAKAVNTLRIETYIDNKGRIHILGSVMRFGTGGNIVDNVSSGGVFVGINEDGCLKNTGLTSMIYGGKSIEIHPDTGFKFGGFKVPFYTESLELCEKLCMNFKARLVGWDIAITENGPVVIEGNTQPGITMGELFYGGYKKHPIYNEIIREA